MDLNQLRCFVMVSQTGSFIRAAERLNLSGPAVSKHINHLEKKLGVSLFHRSTRHVLLSEHGQLLLSKIGPAVANIDEAMAEVTDQKSRPTGRLKVSTPLSFGHHCLLDFFSAFALEYPKVRLELHFEDRYADTNTEDIDVFIRIGQLEPTHHYAKKLGLCPLWLCAHRQLFDRYPKPQTPQEIKNLPAIVYQQNRLNNYWCIKAGNTVEKIPFNIAMITNSAESLVSACVNGVGIAEIPAFSAYPEIQKGQLEILFKDYPSYPQREIFVIYKDKLSQSSRLNKFITALEHHMRGILWS